MSFQKMCISPRNQHMSFWVLSEKAFYILLYLKKHTRHHAIPDSFFCRLSYSSIGFCRCHQRQAGCKPVQSVETHFQSGRNISSQKHALGRDIIISDTGTRIDHQEGSPRVITLCSDTNSDPVESQGLGSSISDFQRHLQSRRSFQPVIGLLFYSQLHFGIDMTTSGKKYPNLFPFFFPYPNVFKNRIQPIVYPDQPVFLKKSIFTTGIPDIDYQIHCLKFKSLIYHLLPASVFSHISRT